MNDFRCIDCDFDTNKGHEYYMVTDKVWYEAGMKHGHKTGDGMLCIGCLENRIGRELCSSDFPEYPINTGFFKQSKRLESRIRSTQ